MGNNLLTTAGAIALAKAINESESSEMEELDLTVGVKTFEKNTHTIGEFNTAMQSTTVLFIGAVDCGHHKEIICIFFRMCLWNLNFCASLKT